MLPIAFRPLSPLRGRPCFRALRRLALVSLALLPGLAPAQPVSDQPFPVLETGMHTALIGRFAVDRAGRYGVSASDDKTARVWNLADGRLLQTLRVPLGQDDEGKLYAVAISPDGERVAVGGWTGPGIAGQISVYFFERASGRIKGRIAGLPNVVQHLAWSPDDQRLAIALGEGGIRVHATRPPYAEIARDADYGSRSLSVDFDRSGRLVSTSFDGKLRLYDTALHLQVPPRAVSGGTRPLFARFAPDGGRIAVGFEDSTAVSVVSGTDLAPLPAMDTSAADNGDLSTVSWSADGRRLFAAGRNRLGDGQTPVRVFDPAKGRQLAAWPAATNTVMDLQPLADGRLLFAAQDPTWGILGPDGRILTQQAPPIPDHRGNFDGFRLSASGDRLSFTHDTWQQSRRQRQNIHFDLNTLTLTLGDAAPSQNLTPPRRDGLAMEQKDWFSTTKPPLAGKPLPLRDYEISRSLAIAADARHFALGSDWYIRWFDAQGRQQWPKPVPATAWLVNTSADGRFVVAALGDGTIRWYRTADGSEALALFVHADARRWVLWTPEGFFAASPDGEGLMGYVLNQGRDKEAEFVSAGQLHTEFNRPDLIAKRIAGDEAAIAAAVKQVGDVRQILARSLPPEIELLSQAEANTTGDYELKLRIASRAGGVGRVLLRKDGVAQETGRGEAPIGGIYSERLRYPPGRYTLSVAVYNANNRILSESRNITLEVRGAAPPKPRLHVLAVGVGKAAYIDNKLATPGVEFADRDARAFVERIAGQAGDGRLYRSVSRRVLTSRAETSLAAIEQALRDIPFESGDTVVIFLAGHGKAVDNKYNFLPADLVFENPQSIAGAALTQERIEGHLRRFGSGRVLLVLDTCNAGKMTETRGLEEAWAIGNLMSQSGQVVLAASGSDEQAFQDRQKKHGIYTLSLLDGLSAADYDGDKLVDVEELAKYLLRDVPARSQKANPGGAIQTPMRSPTKNAFPLVPVPEAHK